jgi:hypothetical protein
MAGQPTPGRRDLTHARSVGHVVRPRHLARRIAASEAPRLPDSREPPCRFGVSSPSRRRVSRSFEIQNRLRARMHNRVCNLVEYPCKIHQAVSAPRQIVVEHLRECRGAALVHVYPAAAVPEGRSIHRDSSEIRPADSLVTASGLVSEPLLSCQSQKELRGAHSCQRAVDLSARDLCLRPQNNEVSVSRAFSGGPAT